jgi:spore germination cell wall hydrolase CwlJ-like protein
MTPEPYSQLSDIGILTLATWREARGEQELGQRGVAWVIANRVAHPCWWSESKQVLPSLWHAVILKPYQFSSFNDGDANARLWPDDDDPAYTRVLSVCSGVILNMDTDPTGGATSYYDTSIGFPKAWGNEAGWENTMNAGRLRFWKPRPIDSATDEAEAGT